MIEKIIMLGGQINAPSENATVHAPYAQLSAAAPELLNSLLEIIDSQILNLDKSDQIPAQNASQILKKAASQKFTDKSLVQDAIAVLKGIKGSVEFTAAGIFICPIIFLS